MIAEMKENNQASRRRFLRNTSLATVAGLSLPSLVSSAFAAEPTRKKIKLQQGDVVLFQGDSITDSGRKKDDSNANNPSALGAGYAVMAASDLLYQYPEKSLKVYNKGISGNKVYQLAERWDKDALDIRPNVLSILIGVNDFWHYHLGRYNGTIQTYRDDYKKLLDRTKQVLPNVQLMIGEPFAVTGVKAVDEKWFPAFDEYRSAARDIAREFDAVFIPYQSIFDKAQKKAPGSYWTLDGVHPSLAGAQLMAHAWMEAVKG